MGRRGPAPKPVELKQLSGNPGKRRLPKSAPKPDGPLPPMPLDRLSDLGQRTWIRLRTILEPIGMLTAADAEDFEMLCSHYAQAVEAAQQVADEGVTLVDRYSRVYRNPADKAALEHFSAFHRLAAQFGMTPTSRTHLAAEADPEDDKSLADLLFEDAQSTKPGIPSRTRLSRIIGAKAAKALEAAGFGTLALASMAAKEGYDLIALKGVGPSTVRKLEELQ